MAYHKTRAHTAGLLNGDDGMMTATTQTVMMMMADETALTHLDPSSGDGAPGQTQQARQDLQL